MAWLGYTVTYFTKEKSKDWHFIRYTDWQMVNGLILPKTLSWYNAEGFKVLDKRNDLEFTEVKLSKTAEAASLNNGLQVLSLRDIYFEYVSTQTKIPLL